MKYCVYCGQELNDNATFCTKCGKEQSKKNTAGMNKKEYKGSNGLSYAIASLCLFCIPILPFVFGIMGLVYGLKANKTSSIVISIISLCLMVLFAIAVLIGGFWYLIPFIISNFPHRYYPTNGQTMIGLFQLLSI